MPGLWGSKLEWKEETYKIGLSFDKKGTPRMCGGMIFERGVCAYPDGTIGNLDDSLEKYMQKKRENKNLIKYEKWSRPSREELGRRLTCFFKPSRSACKEDGKSDTPFTSTDEMWINMMADLSTVNIDGMHGKFKESTKAAATRKN